MSVPAVCPDPPAAVTPRGDAAAARRWGTRGTVEDEGGGGWEKGGRGCLLAGHEGRDALPEVLRDDRRVLRSRLRVRRAQPLGAVRRPQLELDLVGVCGRLRPRALCRPPPAVLRRHVREVRLPSPRTRASRAPWPRVAQRAACVAGTRACQREVMPLGRREARKEVRRFVRCDSQPGGTSERSASSGDSNDTVMRQSYGHEGRWTWNCLKPTLRSRFGLPPGSSTCDTAPGSHAVSALAGKGLSGQLQGHASRASASAPEAPGT